ncbi:MAG: S1 RNA-binding domain-containing protein [bacterium]|nr:S1 RNA-binding domain-containing protein [bacterium]
MSDLSDRTSSSESESDDRRPPATGDSTSHQRTDDAAKLIDDDLAREVEAAMAAMDESELAELTGKAPAPQRDQDEAGAVRQGRVVGIYGDDVFVDLGGKSQAVVPRSQFGKEEVLEIGAPTEVVIERFEPESGLLIASRDGAIRHAHWDSLFVGAVVEGRVTGMNKGGLEVNLNGIRGFLPASQVDIVHVKDISTLLSQKVCCEIIELKKRSRNVLLSRRKVLERERQEAKDKLLAELQPGQLHQGVVGNLTDFGAFVDLGGVDGLLHISDLSYGQVSKVEDLLHVGQTVEVKVLKVDKERGRISLGLKQVKPDPWANAAEKYAVDTRLTVRVLRTEKFGAFAELEAGVQGLIPLSEMSWTRIGRASDVVKVGEMVEAVVIRVEPQKRRIALSLKQTQTDPWSEVLKCFPQDTVCQGKVTKCAEFGAFVEIAPGIEGLVHISELSDRRVSKCEEVVQPGEQVEVRVLGVDTEQRRISLSVKAVHTAPLEAPAGEAPDKEGPPKKKKRKRPLRGGLASHFEWQGQSLEL